MDESKFEAFRKLVLPISRNEDSVYLNNSYQGPMNTIISNSILEYTEVALSAFEPVNPLFLIKCEDVRAKIAKFINTEPQNVAFVRDTIDGLHTFERSIKFEKGDNVVILDNEFPNQAYSWLGLAKDLQVEVRLVSVDDPSKSFNADDLKPFVDSKTKAIGISSVMFLSGVKNDVKSIVQEFKPKGIHVLVDSTQEVGFGEIDVKELGISAMSFALFKAFAIPPGLAVLYVDPSVIPSLKDEPHCLTSASITNLNKDFSLNKNFVTKANAMRFDHPNLAMIQCLALGKFLDYFNDEIGGIKKVQSYIESLGVYLRQQLKQLGVDILGTNDPNLRSPQSNVLPQIIGDEWIQFFKESKVSVSIYRCGCRVSIGMYNNKKDIDRFVEVVKEGINKIGLQQV